jgi:hypothetical protein
LIDQVNAGFANVASILGIRAEAERIEFAETEF